MDNFLIHDLSFLKGAGEMVGAHTGPASIAKDSVFTDLTDSGIQTYSTLSVLSFWTRPEEFSSTSRIHVASPGLKILWVTNGEHLHLHLEVICLSTGFIICGRSKNRPPADTEIQLYSFAWCEKVAREKFFHNTRTRDHPMMLIGRR